MQHKLERKLLLCELNLTKSGIFPALTCLVLKYTLDKTCYCNKKCSFQVRFLVEQGIDHLVSLSPEKIPPHYAFPDLRHTLIPVEDFTGPTIAEIQKFLEICDCARRDGEVNDHFVSNVIL